MSLKKSFINLKLTREERIPSYSILLELLFRSENVFRILRFWQLAIPPDTSFIKQLYWRQGRLFQIFRREIQK